MADKTDAATEDEQAVEDTNLDVLVGFFSSEGTAIPKEVNKTDGNASVDVEDKSILLCGCHLFHSEGVVEEGVRREILVDKLLYEFDTEVGVVDALDLVPNTTDKLVRFARVVDEFSWGQARVLALENIDAASSRAPPNLDPIVKRPEQSDEMRSFPARDVTIVFMAPETAGP